MNKTIIPINDKYRIELDRHAWSIAIWEENKKNPEKSAFVQKFWYPKLTYLMEALQEMMLADAELESIKEIKEILDTNMAMIVSALISYGIENLDRNELKRIA